MIKLIIDKNEEFNIVEQYLAEQQSKRFAFFNSMHGLKLNRKHYVTVKGISYQLMHSFIIVADEHTKKLTPFLLCPGKKRDGLSSQLIGAGSSGRVKIVEAKNVSGTMTKYALKVIKRSNINHSMERISTEATLLKFVGIRHGVFHIRKERFFLIKLLFLFLRIFIKALDIHKTYILMDLIPGKTLVKQVGEFKQMSVTKKLKAAHDLALEYAKIHNYGYAVLDINGGNILYDTESGKITPIDFGMARKIGEIRDRDAVGIEKIFTEKTDVYYLAKIYRGIECFRNIPEANVLIESMQNIDATQRPSMIEVAREIERISQLPKYQAPTITASVVGQQVKILSISGSYTEPEPVSAKTSRLVEEKPKKKKII